MKKFFVLLAIFLAGCGSSEFEIVPVSGTVTFEGEPLEGAEVVFAPMETKDVINVGPPSTGMTDAGGKYMLNTIRGQQGAVATKHRVSIGFKGISGAEVARRVDEVYSKNRSMSEREVIALERKIRKSMTSELNISQAIPKSYNKRTKLRFEVTGETDSADFDLKSDGSL